MWRTFDWLYTIPIPTILRSLGRLLLDRTFESPLLFAGNHVELEALIMRDLVLIPIACIRPTYPLSILRYTHLVHGN